MKFIGKPLAAAVTGLCASLSAVAAPTIVNITEGATTNLASASYGSGAADTIMVAASGSTIVLAQGSGNLAFYPHLVVSGGVVRVTCEEGSSYARYRFVSGIRAVAGGSLEVDGANEISVDRKSIPSGSSVMPATGPLCDIGHVNFTSGSGTLFLRYNATVRRLPDCTVTVLAGDDVVDTTVALACSDGNDAAVLLDDSMLCLTNFNAIALTAAALPTRCDIKVSPGRTFAFRPSTLSADGFTLSATPGSTGRFNIELLGKGAMVRFSNSGGQNMRCESNVTGLGEVLFQPLDSTAITRFRGMSYQASTSSPVSIAVDTPNEPAPSNAWKSKVSHWFDASDETTLVSFTFDPNEAFGWTGARNEFEGHQIIIGMKDKVEGSTISLYNRRIYGSGTAISKSSYLLRVMPYIVTNGLNGLSYLCCGTRGGTVDNAQYDKDGNLTSGSEGRRLRFWNSTDISGDVLPSGDYTMVSAVYAIMVFGSQNGGGESVLGTDGNGNPAHGYLLRDNGINKAWTKNDGFSMHVDGLTANPKSDKPNGGWQIVSLDMSATNTVIHGLGTKDNNTSESGCGGQNYAEVIFFSEKPTVAERAACEQYLADKWGLSKSYVQWDVGPGQLSGSGGTVMLYDDGRPSYESVEEISAEGSFSGTVQVPSGRTLVLDKPVPPSEKDVPEANRVGWYDPDFDGATTFDGDPDYGHAELLNILYSRTLNGLLMSAGDKMFSSGWRSGKNGNFAPRVVNEVRGPLTTGPSRKWMVFKEKYNDGVGNMIRSRKVGDGVTGALSAIPIRQAFFVTDTSAGGGNIIGDNSVFGKGLLQPRAGNNVNEPIWSSTNNFTMTSTWLDTAEIDGEARGYNGRPEVLSFTTPRNYNFGYVAKWDGVLTEVVGEFILYSSPLDAVSRTNVQEYLMYKWFGDLNGKYADYTGATVTGAGDVKSQTLRNLPKFGAGFTGALKGGSQLSFTVGDRDAGVADPIDIDRALVLEDGATVAVNFAGNGKPMAGSYTLLTATSITGTATLSAVGLRENRSATLHVGAGEISIEITAPGTMILVK